MAFTRNRAKDIDSARFGIRKSRSSYQFCRREGLDPGDGNDFYRLSLSVHAFLARSGAAIAMVQLEDLIGEIITDKSPGYF